MDSTFYSCVINSFRKHAFAQSYETNLQESILHDQFQDQIVVMTSKLLKLGFVLEKHQVQFLLSRVGVSEWFDLSSLIYFLSDGHDDWVFGDIKQPITPQKIEDDIDKLLNNFQKYEREIVQLLASQDIEKSRLDLLRESMNKRWESRRKTLKRKMRFPFF